MNEENLYLFFKGFKDVNVEFVNDDNNEYITFDINEEFYIDTGVSTEMIKSLCNEIGRTMYAYDDDDKCFNSITKFKSDHYAPVVFYKMNGHFYLINDPKIIKRVGESNKSTMKKIITTIIEEMEQKDNLINNFDVENAK